MQALEAEALADSQTPQFSGGALTYVPWHFIHDRPLQLLVRRLSITHLEHDLALPLPN
jgi:hypothetical protein